MIEGVALHARNLMGLFGKGNKWPNDIRAITYCPQFAAPAGFDCMWNRVNEQIAHLTTQRITDAQQVATEKDKMWRPEQFRELIHGTKEFVQQMLKASHPLSPDLSRRLDCLISKLNEAPAIGATGMAGPPYGT
jgi:hypothetical protein